MLERVKNLPKSDLFLPKTIGIELVRGCNLECPMCPVTANMESEENRYQFIQSDLLKKIVDEIDKHQTIEDIYFFHFGEPLTHPAFAECLEILYKSNIAKKANVILYTNATLLHGSKARAILDIPIINELIFSFDGFGDKKSFEHLRGPYFDKVISNIRNFAKSAQAKRPDLLLKTSTILPRKDEVPDLEIPTREEVLKNLGELFDPFGVSIETKNMHNYSGDDNLTISGIPPKQIQGGCSFLEDNSIYITVNGFAQPCCAEYNEAFNFGNVKEDTFIEILNNSKIRDLRHILRLDQRENLEFCESCSLSIVNFLCAVFHLGATWHRLFR